MNGIQTSFKMCWDYEKMETKWTPGHTLDQIYIKCAVSEGESMNQEIFLFSYAGIWLFITEGKNLTTHSWISEKY